MASRKSPLRDRLLSNSPDPIKSSILRESGMGWNTPTSNGSIQPSGSTGSITSPLRIAKRDSPSGRVRGPAVARRTSSSYRHVHNNNLVSKSPFKSLIPTPSTPSSRPPPISFPTRKVSGEKRPRPSSMHELGETENDRPFALKRDRKQSKTFQGLIDKEPVTKSPFRVQQKQPVSQPPKPPLAPIQNEQSTLSSTPPAPSHISPPVSTPNNGPSPGRSALVSRRMHGPRLSGGSRRERRKTVTFHERCDVLEFDREDTEDEVFESSDEESRDETPHDLQNEDESMTDSSRPNNDPHDVMEDDASYESVGLSDSGHNPPVPSLLADPDASINGIVDEMFFETNAANLLADISMISGTSTPPRHADIPTDLETEDGVPFGRSHHVERFMQSEHSLPSQPPPHFSPHSSPAHQASYNQSPSYLNSFNLPTHASPLGPPATPPRRSPGVRYSTPPLGRSTHVERIRKAREEERVDQAEGDDVAKLPLSPSPMKKPSTADLSHDDSLIPKFDLNAGSSAETEVNSSTNINLDPFEHRIQDESTLPGLDEKDISEIHEHERPLSPGSISIGNSEVNLSALVSERDCEEVLQSLNSSFHSEGRSRREGSVPRTSPPPSDYFPPVSRHMTPPVHSGSPLLAAVQSTHSLGKVASRERISREEVQRRLMIQRSPGSPMPDKVATQSPRPTIFVDPAGDIATPSKRSMSSSLEVLDPETNRLSVLTTQTDFSTETAIVDTAEKRNLGMTMLSASHPAGDNEFGLLGPSQRLQFDFGSKFSVGGLGISSKDVDSRHNEGMRQNHELAVEPAPSTMSIQSTSTSGMKMGDVDVDMDMKSALDRLMEDVAGAGARAEDSIMSDEYDESYDHSRSHEDHDRVDFTDIHPKIMERAATDSALLQQSEVDGIHSRTASGSSTLTAPPPVPPKDNIRQREQIILEKRREARRIEEEGSSGFKPSRGKDQEHLGVGRPSRRRSMSTGDAEVLGGGARKRGNALLDIANPDTGDDPLADSIEKELQKLVEPAKKSKYHVRERETTIYASSSDEKVSHMAGPGDVDTGRAWRTVRRPSDMNEYAKQIKEYRAQDKGKAYGKVFVKVLGIRGMHLPLPHEATAFTCTLNNGIHFVTTPECQLLSDCRIEQEFELIEHSKLEFTLTLKVRRDPHIIAQFKALAPSAPAPAPPPVMRPPVVAQTASKSSGMRSFFSSSPKKSSKDKIVVQPPPVQQQPLQPQRLVENLARHLKPDGTLARAFISFKDIAARCDTRLFETSYPLIGQRVEVGGKFSPLEVGEIVLQLFRLPPLPGIPQDQLPQSLEECHRGLRHINWHKVTYFQGTLTQIGGDCSTWRRRQLRVIGANLVAFNDVTKKATATIDLKKAIAVEDDQEARNNAQSPGGTSRYADEYDGLYGVERSFRLIFPQSQEIIFFADTDEEKSKWLDVLRALVGRIPPHPLWAELLWQRQEEISKRMNAAQQTVPQTSPIDSRRPQH
ncbi:Septin ring organizing protein mid2 [Psilocybe cubensis]|uniref:PH domain-containing protein n=2 Tax=Psilocybe cubensis TaxID=181762 RepID=A0A8H7Y4Y9_PSICU|nr:Septin ring organizing protein mid2 [Psilocybe cubensis]KAH9485096.1 Septin ring organizing protein mid2 [Psilocybe cubensis]